MVRKLLPLLLLFSAAQAAEIGYVINTDETIYTTTSSTFTSPSSCDITSASLDGSSDYVLMFYAGMAGSDIAQLVNIRVHDGTSTLTASDAVTEADAANTEARHDFFFMDRVTTASTPATYSLEVASPDNLTTVGISGCWSFAIKVGELLENTDFYWNEDTTNNADLSSSLWTDGASVTIGDGTSDYLVAATTYWLIDSTTDDYSYRLDVGGTTRVFNRDEGENTGESRSVGLLTAVEAPAASTTVTIEAQTSADLHDLTNSKIFALRLDTFTDHLAEYVDGDIITHSVVDTTAEVDSVTKAASQGGTNQLNWIGFGSMTAGDEVGSPDNSAHFQGVLSYQIAAEGENILWGDLTDGDSRWRRHGEDSTTTWIGVGEIPLVDDTQNVNVVMDSREDQDVLPTYDVVDSTVIAFTADFTASTSSVAVQRRRH